MNSLKDRLYEDDNTELESVDNNYNLPNSTKRKKKWMSCYELSEIIVAKNIKNGTELLAN